MGSAGAVDIVRITPDGSGILADGYTYIASVVGQSTGGDAIACLTDFNFISISTDNATGQEWGDNTTLIGAGAQSDTDGAGNTAVIGGFDSAIHCSSAEFSVYAIMGWVQNFSDGARGIGNKSSN